MIDQPFSSAGIRVTDILGRVVQEQCLRLSRGKVVFDGSLHAPGLYYTSLIVDGVVVKNKTMLIQR